MDVAYCIATCWAGEFAVAAGETHGVGCVQAERGVRVRGR